MTYFDGKSDPDAPRWFMFNIVLVKKFQEIIPLVNLRNDVYLDDMQLLRKGNRLSITPVSLVHWEHIIGLARK